MEQEKVVTQNSIAKEIQLVKGQFTPNQAMDIILSLFHQKINYHKIERMQLWEKNHKSDQTPLNKRIAELEAEKKSAEEFLLKMKSEGHEVMINGVLEFTIVQ